MKQEEVIVDNGDGPVREYVDVQIKGALEGNGLIVYDEFEYSGVFKQSQHKENVVMDVRYDNFQKIEDGLILPHQITLLWPLFDSYLRLEFGNIRINRPVPPDIFNYPKSMGLPPDTRYRPLVPKTRINP